MAYHLLVKSDGGHTHDSRVVCSGQRVLQKVGQGRRWDQNYRGGKEKEEKWSADLSWPEAGANGVVIALSASSFDCKLACDLSPFST